MARLTPEEVERIKSEMRFDWEISIAMRPALAADARSALDDQDFAPALVRNIRVNLDPYLAPFVANGCRRPKAQKWAGPRRHRKRVRFTEKFRQVVRSLVERCRGGRARKPEIRKAARRVELYIVEVIRHTDLADIV